MKFQLVGKITYDEMNLNTASGDSMPVSKNVLEEFDAVDNCSAIEQAKSVAQAVINRHCPETNQIQHFTGLEAELRIIKPVWKTSIKPGNYSWEPKVKAEIREVTL